jgi:hypothetical protein
MESRAMPVPGLGPLLGSLSFLLLGCYKQVAPMELSEWRESQDSARVIVLNGKHGIRGDLLSRRFARTGAVFQAPCSSLCWVASVLW